MQNSLFSETGVKVVHDQGWATTATMVAGLRYALSNGARIVNISLNGPDSSQALDEAIGQAEQQGVLVIASAGNDAANRDRVPSYPASVRSRAVITVASATRAGWRQARRTGAAASTSPLRARRCSPASWAGAAPRAPAHPSPRPT